MPVQTRVKCLQRAEGRTEISLRFLHQREKDLSYDKINQQLTTENKIGMKQILKSYVHTHARTRKRKQRCTHLHAYLHTFFFFFITNK